MMTLIMIANRIFISWNSAFKDTNVVIVPAPAIIGNARGTILAVLPVTSSLNSFTPRIISIAMANKMIAPATAKDSTVTPNNFRMLSPRMRKPIMMKKETILVLAS